MYSLMVSLAVRALALIIKYSSVANLTSIRYFRTSVLANFGRPFSFLFFIVLIIIFFKLDHRDSLLLSVQ
ncbi:hypothetical protein BN938_2632 [Mucinivorans hirudinis]|uniref:Uncharacterized protein n=1 Tax=Mucinivorans hirudinis TaxID=1433126 RepID=A0A060RAS1_9BACT|nr:hypothetical protein BN938_2632 [Mucinivorans hirudinis]